MGTIAVAIPSSSHVSTLCLVMLRLAPAARPLLYDSALPGGTEPRSGFGLAVTIGTRPRNSATIT